jgi:hypothetical protein
MGEVGYLPVEGAQGNILDEVTIVHVVDGDLIGSDIC